MTDQPREAPVRQIVELPGHEICQEPRAICSEELFAGARTIRIKHAGETYRLLITRNNRLILQK
jgi:hemin uptake protein HemP